MNPTAPDLNGWHLCTVELPPLNIRVRVWDTSRDLETHSTRMRGLEGLGEWVWCFRHGVTNLQSLFSHWQFIDPPPGLRSAATA